MCCHKAAVSSTHKRPREWSGIISSGARTHDCVAPGASLRPRKESSWQSVTWLFSPVCLSVRQTRGPSWKGPLAVPLSGAESLSLPISSRCVVAVLSTLNNVRWFLGDGDEYCKWFLTTREMLTMLSQSNRLTLFYSPLWLVNWSPAPCWHSDPDGEELLLSRHALTSLFHPPHFHQHSLPLRPNLCSHPPPRQHTPWLNSICVDPRPVTCCCASGGCGQVTLQPIKHWEAHTDCCPLISLI